MRKKDISDAIGNINDRYIEEAADFQRKKKRTGKSSILQKSVAAAASFILVFILSVSTLVAADFSPAYEFLYTLSPSAAQKLKPVSMISEDNGIKIEVISAYVESGEAKILILYKIWRKTGLMKRQICLIVLVSIPHLTAVAHVKI